MAPTSRILLLKRYIRKSIHWIPPFGLSVAAMLELRGMWIMLWRGESTAAATYYTQGIVLDGKRLKMKTRLLDHVLTAIEQKDLIALKNLLRRDPYVIHLEAPWGWPVIHRCMADPL